MDLKSKLGIYSKQSSAPIKQEPVRQLELLKEAGGEEIHTRSGTLWRFEHRLSTEKVYSTSVINNMISIKPFLQLNGFDTELKIEDLLFFDLETTSLSMGAGNYPFVVGLGYIDGDDFVCEQLFMESFSDEIAILEYLLDFFKSSKAVVSFNGNSFDLPLIKNRYMMHRIYGFPVDMVKIDLIVPSRRIFKSIYENCALQTLEKNLLEFERVGDVPGWMIPEIYFTYQKDGNPDRIPGVIEHNRYDIYSMYYLLLVLNDLSENILNSSFEKFEQSSLFNMARYLYRTNAEMFLDLAEFLGNDIIGDKGVFERFSITLKRAGEWKRAIKYWEKSGSLFSLVELAKYYEHKEKDYKKALIYCKEAINIKGRDDIESTLPDGEQNKVESPLLKRKQRLLEKLDRIS